MIPKIIHYVWLGKDDRSIKRYLSSWKKYNPDFKIIRWDETNIDFSLPYLKNALSVKNWANISNYVRLDVLDKFGGIYLDTDVLLLKQFDDLLDNQCFLGFQFSRIHNDWVNNAVFGAVPNHWFVRKAKQYLLSKFDGFEAANESSPTMMTKLLKEYGLKHYSKNGIMIKDIKIYPTNTFYPYAWNSTPDKANINKNTYAIHEWKKRWEWKPKPKLVMTLLVRDEEDILEKNICFHLSQGVDHIIAMDNNSVDRTPNILHKYERLGMLTYLHQPDNTYEQSKWVSQMAKLAVEKYGATHLIHCDADEFWYPASGNLKSVLPVDNEIFIVNSLTYFPTKLSFLPIRDILSNPIPYFAQMDRELSYRYLLYRYQPKVLTTNNYTEIMQGNHGIITNKKVIEVSSNSILIHHFPIRSFRQFKNKVINGGSSYQNNPEHNPSLGWQWQEWYQLSKYGFLKDLYQGIIMSNSEKRILRFRGIITRIIIPKHILFAPLIFWFNKYRIRLKTIYEKLSN